MKVEFQHSTGRSTLLGLSGNIPQDWRGSEVILDGERFRTEIVYDLPGHIAIIGKGDFVGKQIQFI